MRQASKDAPALLLLAGVATLVACGAVSWRRFSAGGLDPCARLDESICRELGAAGCAVWVHELERIGSPTLMKKTGRSVLDLMPGFRTTGFPGACRATLADRMLQERLVAGIRQAVDGARSTSARKR